jgi:transposase-like protein
VARYSEDQKQAVLARMSPPENRPVAALARETGIPAVTLYAWRRHVQAQGGVVPGNGENPERWRSADKFAVVVETARLNETELSEYCRTKGLYVEQVRRWREACEQANAWAETRQEAGTAQRREDQKRIKALERELARKEKALAEAAALLVLRKKLAALRSEDEDV